MYYIFLKLFSIWLFQLRSLFLITPSNSSLEDSSTTESKKCTLGGLCVFDNWRCVGFDVTYISLVFELLIAIWLFSHHLLTCVYNLSFFVRQVLPVWTIVNLSHQFVYTLVLAVKLDSIKTKYLSTNNCHCWYMKHSNYFAFC